MKVQFVAEIASNHNQDLHRCLALVDCAAEMGCSGVKFQLFKVKELFAREILATSQTHRQRETWELPVSYLPVIAARCNQLNLSFGCTPFYMDAVETLYPYVDFYKISSYELCWSELLAACAVTEKPVVLSTGLATSSEVVRAVEVLSGAGCQDLSLMHCVSQYPVALEECNLAAIRSLRRQHNCKVGWSDHSANPSVIYRAVHRWEASLIEFHLDLDRKGAEYDTGHCWLPDKMRKVIADVRCGLAADGDGIKKPRAGERLEVEWRADPSDGLRPFGKIRKSFIGDSASSGCRN